MTAAKLFELSYRDRFRSLSGAAFQLWFEKIAQALYAPGQFQAIRNTSGDGGLDGFVIDSSLAFQVYAPARMSESRDADTATKIKADFRKAFVTLNGNIAGWTFVHNHPEGKLGKASIAAINELKTKHAAVDISVLGIDTLWDKLRALPHDKLSAVLEIADVPTAGPSDPARNVSSDLAAANSKLDELLSRINSQSGVPFATLRAILRAFGEHDVLDPEIETKLWEKATEYQLVKEQLQRMPHSDPRVAQLIIDAEKDIDAGLLHEGREKLLRVADFQRHARRELEAVQSKAKEEEVETFILLARIALLASDVLQAVSYRDRASELIEDQEKRLFHDATTADYLSSYGNRSDDIDRMEEGGKRAQAVAAAAKKANLLSVWTYASDIEGVALTRIGTRALQERPLRDAIKSFEEILKVATLDRDPTQWATSQNNLGEVLRHVGERRQEEQVLSSAVAAYRCALEVYSKSQYPRQRAMVLSNLGNGLSALADIQPKRSLLAEATSVYREALTLRPREDGPISWAMTLDSLGTSLVQLGCLERSKSKRRKLLLEAIEAHSGALEELRRELVPFEWAIAMNCLGAAYGHLAYLEKGSWRFAEAIDAYTQAQEVWTVDRASHKWAICESNIASLLVEMSKRENDPGLAQKALNKFECTIPFFRAANAEKMALRIENEVSRLRAGQLMKSRGSKSL